MPGGKLDKVLYTADTHTTGGRDGHAKSNDGRLAVVLSPPGTAGKGTNPEQLFAAGYSACFIGAMKAVAPHLDLQVPADVAVDAQVDLGSYTPASRGYGVAARLSISLPGLDKGSATRLVEEAHKVCPYSNATRNNIEVTLTLK